MPTLPDNRRLQQAAVDAAGQGALVLTPTGRLSRHLRHLARLGGGGVAKPRLEIVSLKDWVRRQWLSLWPEEALAPEALRMRLWQRACAVCPPPGGLESGLRLAAQLDAAYAALVRHALPSAPNVAGPDLASWRSECCAAFERLLSESGLLHPARLTERLTEALTAGRLRPPESIVLAAFSAPAPVEERLFEALAGAAKLTRLASSAPAAPDRRLFSLPRLRDEVEWCAREVLAAAEDIPLHEIGVVVPSMDDYGPELRRALRELLGEPVGEDWSAYNLAAPGPLSEAPLVRAALLPLRFMAEDEPRELLLALLTSPYYRRWQGVRHRVARADRAWRELSVEGGLRPLLAAARREGVLGLIECGEPTLSALLETLRGRATLTEWAARLRGLWRSLGFPEVSGEADANARRHFADALEGLEVSLGSEVVDARGLSGWLGHALGAKSVAAPGLEHAGVQILGLIEAGGLSFRRLFVLGLHERGLPRPVRPLPLLHAQERRSVRGGTWESQLAFARAALADLMAAGDEVWLSRPRLGEEEAPLLPSPLWPGDVAPDVATAALYDDGPAPRWAGAPWLEAAREAGGPPPAAPPESFQASVALPGVLPATSLANVLGCPFRFLLGDVLGIEPLEEPQVGVRAMDRGTRLHRALACLTSRIRQRGLGAGGLDKGGLSLAEAEALLVEALLAECTEAALAGLDHDPFWGLERRRWLGERGLLPAWLAQQGGALAACLAEEVEFRGLRPPGWPFEVRGKIDRLDAAASEAASEVDGETKGEVAGLVCWDYKTGASLTPGTRPLLEHPQLAAYGLAVEADLVAGFEGHSLSGLGYLHLPIAGGVDVKVLRPEGGLTAGLAAFVAEVAARAARLAAGDFTPTWQECLGERRNACPYEALCGLLGRPDDTAEPEEVAS